MFKKLLVVIGLLAFAGFANAESRLQKSKKQGNCVWEPQVIGIHVDD